jgi:hypothetical protein
MTAEAANNWRKDCRKLEALGTVEVVEPTITWEVGIPLKNNPQSKLKLAAYHWTRLSEGQPEHIITVGFRNDGAVNKTHMMAEVALALRDFAYEQLGTGGSPDPAADILFAGWTRFYGLDQVGQTSLPRWFSQPSYYMLGQLFSYEDTGRMHQRFLNTWFSSISTKIPSNMSLADFQVKLGDFLRRRVVGYAEKTAADRKAIEERFFTRKQGWFSKRRPHFDLAKKMGFDIGTREKELMKIESRLENILSKPPETLLAILVAHYGAGEVQAELRSAGLADAAGIRPGYPGELTISTSAERKNLVKAFARNFILDELRLGSERLVVMLGSEESKGYSAASREAWSRYYDAFQQFLLDYSIDLTPVSSSEGVYFKSDPENPNALWVFGYTHESKGPEEFIKQMFTNTEVSNVNVLQEMEISDYAYPLIFTARLTLP